MFETVKIIYFILLIKLKGKIKSKKGTKIIEIFCDKRSVEKVLKLYFLIFLNLFI
jgi:hypothetical protein